MAEALCEKCEDPFTDPRILPCLHSFCLKCLQKLSENTNEPFQCPTCDEKVPLPDSGVVAFPRDQCKAYEAEKARLNDKIEKGEEKCDQCVNSDAAVAFCVQCSDFLCEACRDHHSRWRKTADHEIVPTGERLSKGDEGSVMNKYRPQPLICSTHTDEKLKFYCNECKELICRDCIGSEVHRSHNDQCLLINEVADKEMKSLELSVGICNGAVRKLDDAINSCKKTKEDVKARKKAVDNMITSTIERVRETLLEQNATICDKKVGTLEAQERALVRIRKGLAHASHLIKESSHYTPEQQLSTKDVIATRVDELQKEFQGKDLEPQEDDRFLTKVDQEATITKVITLCQVSEGAHAASSTFKTKIPSHIYTGKEYTMKIAARNRQGKTLGCGGERVKVSMGPRGAGIRCQCTDNHDGTYTVKYTPQSVGQNELHAMIAGQPIKGSPLKITVKQSRPYATLKNQDNFGTNSNPSDVAITEDGHIAVAEYGGHTVSIYDKNTKGCTFRFGNGGAGAGTNQLYYPQGVAIRGDTVYVAESGYSRIKTFSISQRQQKSIIADGQLSYPRGICVDSQGKVFVADSGNNRIQVFKDDGSLQYSIPPVADGQFQNPWGIAFDLDSNLHIAAYGSHCIKVYSPTGSYIDTYGSGTVSSPAGIAVNGEGVIAISENGGNNRLWLYDHDRKTLLNTITGAFSNGYGIACDDEDVFWVAGYSNKHVFKF